VQALDLDAILPRAARVALAKATDMRMSYAVRYVIAPDRRLIVAIGEAHVKLAKASLLGKEIVRHFALRGVETFPVHKVVGGRALGVLIHYPRILLRHLSLGFIKGSTITDARALPTGRTFGLEDHSKMPFGLHVASIYLGVFFCIFWVHAALTLAHALRLPVDAPLAVLTTASRWLAFHMFAMIPAYIFRRWSFSWLIHPAVSILTLRDVTMAEGTVVMLREVPEPRAAVVIMGRAHLLGYERELVEKHGFQRVD